MKQNFARKFVIPIDEIEVDFMVFSEENKLNKDVAPKDGAYIFGLFLEGCRWDADLNQLAESQPKKLYTVMPYIWLIPKKRTDIVFDHCYTCPVYKTLDRRGTLSTTGHSTNFLLMIELPM
jgi:dynein heavy chain, axonemal